MPIETTLPPENTKNSENIKLEVAILNLAFDQILQFIFYIILAILEFLPSNAN